jgi:hypothetical protein
MTYYDGENIPFKGCRNSKLQRERRTASMRLFRRKGHAVKKWHERAMMIDPKKTKLTIISTDGAKHIPPWVYKKFSMPQIKE